MSKRLQFPEGFLWGAATSAHQVEGGNRNDWTEWEQENADRLSRKAKDIYEPWQQEQFPGMFDPKNYISGKAADHWNRYEEDFDIAKELGHNVHRISLEWSRIEPEEGKFDEEAIQHYKDVIQALRDRGIEPFVTLWHWTFPVWLSKKGGWDAAECPRLFARYVARITDELADEVTYWITLNEPQIYSGNGYFKGIWPPNKKGIFSYLKMIHSLTEAHKSAYDIIKQHDERAKVGTSRDYIYFSSHGDWRDHILNSVADWWWNHYFERKIFNKLDFIGVNYYFKKELHLHAHEYEERQVSDMNWEIYPRGLYDVLLSLKTYNKPIYITENGLADAKDKYRESYIRESLESVYSAIQDGVPVKGYLHWSLLDNFEWDKGFWPRFGLVEVDFKTQERMIRPSAYAYAEICKSNALEVNDAHNS